MKKNIKIVILIVGILIVLGLLVWMLFFKQTKTNNIVPTNNATSTVKEVAPSVSTPKVVNKKVPVINVPVAIYSDVVKQYEGYRFQFSSNCTQVSPASFVIKKGLKFMIDNRDDKQHLFGFLKTNYTIKPYSYVVVTATTAGNYFVMCDGVRRSTVTVAP